LFPSPAKASALAAHRTLCGLKYKFNHQMLEYLIKIQLWVGVLSLLIWGYAGWAMIVDRAWAERTRGFGPQGYAGADIDFRQQTATQPVGSDERSSQLLF
jgi:hypothetical protein